MGPRGYYNLIECHQHLYSTPDIASKLFTSWVYCKLHKYVWLIAMFDPATTEPLSHTDVFSSQILFSFHLVSAIVLQGCKIFIFYRWCQQSFIIYSLF